MIFKQFHHCHAVSWQKDGFITIFHRLKIVSLYLLMFWLWYVHDSKWWNFEYLFDNCCIDLDNLFCGIMWVYWYHFLQITFIYWFQYVKWFILNIYYIYICIYCDSATVVKFLISFVFEDLHVYTVNEFEEKLLLHFSSCIMFTLRRL